MHPLIDISPFQTDNFGTKIWGVEQNVSFQGWTSGNLTAQTWKKDGPNNCSNITRNTAKKNAQIWFKRNF